MRNKYSDMVNSASGLFDSSLEAIRNTLSDADRASFREFATHKEMIAEIRLIIIRHENKSRMSVLVHPSRFEGVEQLYGQILEILGRSNETERAVSGTIFQWISYSMFPLGLRALHTALAIIPGKPTDKLQYLADFPGCVPRITCALVEIMDDDAAFIHLSFKEHLEAKDGAFSLKDKSAANMQLATKCLPFLTYDVPAEPLDSLEDTARYSCPRWPEASANNLQATTTQEAQIIRSNVLEKLHKKYPLLRYASLCWYEHINIAHVFDRATEAEQGRDPCLTRASETLDSWIPILAGFLVRRYTVTMWVEACGIYRLLPQLNTLAFDLNYLANIGSLKTATGREVLWVASGLHQVAGALESLGERHSTELWGNPSLIWQRDITTAVDRSFWPVWDKDDADIRASAHRFEIDADSGFLPDYRNFPGPSDLTYSEPFRSMRV